MLRITALAAAASLSLFFSSFALAHDVDDHAAAHEHDHAACGGEVPEHLPGPVVVGDFTFEGAFTRATMPNAPSAGGYVTITNTGSVPDRLVAVSTPRAEEMEIHEMAVVDDIMRMSELPDGLEIGAGETVSLAPGGLHLMFFRIDGQFVEGESVPVSFVFEEAGEITIDFAIAGVAAMSAHGH